MNIKTLIKDNTVRFARLRKGLAYYKIADPGESGQTYLFPVPLEELGDATLLAEDKAILFMRYIRRAIEENTLVSDRAAHT